jgi:glycosyltransferase involved in cell wall biosynthesis
MDSPPTKVGGLSACIICQNEATRIGVCLDSLAWCQDIVIVDSGSTDATLEIARAHITRPRIVHQDWLGFNPQRRVAVEQCRHDWVLMLDADEECSPELAAEIRVPAITASKNVAIYQMPRRNYLGGRYVRCWSPDFQARLIHRGRVVWDERPLPEIRTAKAGYRTASLRGSLLHGRVGGDPMVDVSDGRKMAAYAVLLAGHLRARGKRASFLDLLLRPLLTFFKYYILRGGFLDGRFGLVIAYKTTIGVMLKYSVLYAMEELRSGVGINHQDTKTPR